MQRTLVATADDGSQVLVVLYDSGGAHVATRKDTWATWSPPLSVAEEPA